MKPPLPCIRAPVHPRVCGEHRNVALGSRQANGSSPRVRGTLARFGPRWRGTGFIPACAGNTATVPSPTWSFTVHPRVCGEHNDPGPIKYCPGGSSPRVRGTQRNANAIEPGRRFIPACAGNTRVRHRSVLGMAVHPRVCGEHERGRRGSEINDGSSPRVRGTPEGGRGSRRQARFIPACAGNTNKAACVPSMSAVHPRVCGEHN